MPFVVGSTQGKGGSPILQAAPHLGAASGRGWQQVFVLQVAVLEHLEDGKLLPGS